MDNGTRRKERRKDKPYLQYTERRNTKRQGRGMALSGTEIKILEETERMGGGGGGSRCHANKIDQGYIVIHVSQRKLQ